MNHEMAEFNVGDEVLFDHFGGTDRRGRVVKATKSKVHIEWTAPSSGKTRVVPIGLQPHVYARGTAAEQSFPAEILAKNVRVQEATCHQKRHAAEARQKEN